MLRSGRYTVGLIKFAMALRKISTAVLPSESRWLVRTDGKNDPKSTFEPLVEKAVNYT